MFNVLSSLLRAVLWSAVWTKRSSDLDAKIHEWVLFLLLFLFRVLTGYHDNPYKKANKYMFSFQGANRLNISEVLFPAVCGIIRAQDYSSFRAVIQREIENTVGWEQVYAYFN